MRAFLSGRRFSLRKVLRWVVVVSVLPVALVAMLLLYSVYVLQREHVQQSTLLTAQSVLSDLEREMAVIESGLHILATAPELVSGDLRGFHQRARDALAPGIVYNYILTDRSGRQLLNTLLPYGSALPSTGTPAQIDQVFTQRKTVLTDLFIGPVTRKPALAMGVPVGAGDQVAYSLNIGMDPARLSVVLGRKPLAEGWLVAVLDSSGTIISRSREAERFVGQKAVPEVAQHIRDNSSGTFDSVTKDGVPVITAFVTSENWGWTVVVGAPKSALQNHRVMQWAWVGLGVACAVALGLLLARAISLRVLASVHQLNQAAEHLSQGAEVRLPALQMVEADAVGRAIVEAADAMKKIRFFAEHDTLTELPNRMLFETVSNRDLAVAARKSGKGALLAVDLDKFKLVNDTLGHEAGDAVLRLAARRLQQVIRTSDMAARIGGDEFLVYLADIDAADAMDIARRIVELLSAPYERVDIGVSASVGVALFAQHGSSLRELSAAADGALYQAKRAGRKQAVLAQSAPA